MWRSDGERRQGRRRCNGMMTQQGAMWDDVGR